MPLPHVLILGAGAAGAAAARRLGEVDTVSVTTVGLTDEAPYNRTLVNKAVAIGLFPPQLAAMPGAAPVHSDTAESVDVDARTVTLASGETVTYDALIVATGSRPRTLAQLPGAAEAIAAGRVSTLHSLDDAVRVRDLLTGAPRRVILVGGGLVAAETVTLLRQHEHEVTLVSRSELPGATAFGAEIAARLADAHRANLTPAFGRAPVAVRLDGDEVELVLDDDTVLRADLVIAALGTVPAAPAPWSDGVEVDDRLRAEAPGVAAAGGVARHTDELLGTWRIDHWADAEAQGAHAAAAVLHHLGLGDDPGAYRPRSGFAAVVHGRSVAGAGFTDGDEGTVVDADPLLIAHERDGMQVGVIGLDAAGAVFGRIPQLFTAPSVAEPS